MLKIMDFWSGQTKNRPPLASIRLIPLGWNKHEHLCIAIQRPIPMKIRGGSLFFEDSRLVTFPELVIIKPWGQSGAGNMRLRLNGRNPQIPLTHNTISALVSLVKH